MTHDEIAALADRTEAKRRRGEEWEFEFAIEFGALTGAERDGYMALMNGRIAHGKEVLEALEANVRVLQALLVLQVERAPGMDLTEAIGSGRVGIMEVIEAIRNAVPDALAQGSDD